jgi:MoaA/NifB/PqqE/SkfB family radical SAM enzyme
MISKTFCILPWIHLSTRPNGHMRVCCTANASSAGKTNDKKYGGEIGILKEDDGLPSNLGHHDLLTSWNNTYMRNIRLMMLNGDIPPPCSKCFIEEKAGHKSKRNWETAYWSKRIDVDRLIKNTAEDGSVPPEIYYMDLRMGTKCNLKCIMCSPHDSSLWEDDWHKLYPQIKNPSLKQLCGWSPGSGGGGSYQWHKNNPAFWEQLNDQIPNIRQLYFAGGEALIIEKHYELLEDIAAKGYGDQIELRYNSNGIYMPQRLFDLWDKFYKVRFHFSVDSIKDMNDYIRWPPTWNKVVKNMKRIDETSDHVEVTVACAVQALNIYYIPDLIKWKLSMNFKKINPYEFGAGLVNFHFVYHPAFLNVRILPQWFKDKTKEKYEDFYEWLKVHYRSDQDFLDNPYGIKRLKGLINFMMSDDWSVRIPEFIEYINLMDGIRGSNFRETFPEMGRLLDE